MGQIKLIIVGRNTHIKGTKMNSTFFVLCVLVVMMVSMAKADDYCTDLGGSECEQYADDDFCSEASSNFIGYMICRKSCNKCGPEYCHDFPSMGAQCLTADCNEPYFRDYLCVKTCGTCSDDS